MKSQFVRFLLVGGVNTLVGYGFFAFFLFSGFHYTVSVLFATIIGVLFNFFTIGGIGFINSKNSLVFRFLSVYAIVYLLNIIGLRISELFNFNLYLSGAALVFPLALVSYTLNKKFVFKLEKGK